MLLLQCVAVACLLALVSTDKTTKEELKTEESIFHPSYTQGLSPGFGYEHHSTLGPGKYDYIGSTPLYYPDLSSGYRRYSPSWLYGGLDGIQSDYGSYPMYVRNYGSQGGSYDNVVERLRERLRAGFSNSNVLFKNIKSSNFYEGYFDDGKYREQYISGPERFSSGYNNFDHDGSRFGGAFGGGYNRGLGGSYSTDQYGYMTGNGYGTGHYNGGNYGGQYANGGYDDRGYIRRQQNGGYTRKYKETLKSAYSNENLFTKTINNDRYTNKYLSSQYQPPPPPPIRIPVPPPVSREVTVAVPTPVAVPVPSPVSVPVPVPVKVPVPVSVVEPAWQGSGASHVVGGHLGVSNFGGFYGVPNYIGLEANGQNRVAGSYIKYGAGIPPAPPLDVSGYLNSRQYGERPYGGFIPLQQQNYQQWSYGSPNYWSYRQSLPSQSLRGQWGQYERW